MREFLQERVDNLQRSLPGGDAASSCAFIVRSASSWRSCL